VLTNKGGLHRIAGTNLVSTTIGVLFLDRYGRRRTLLTGIPVAIIALTMASMCFFFMTKPTGGKLDTVTPGGYPYEQRWVIPMILMMVLYVSLVTFRSQGKRLTPGALSSSALARVWAQFRTRLSSLCHSRFEASVQQSQLVSSGLATFS
jgi:hypothetical protein